MARKTGFNAFQLKIRGALLDVHRYKQTSQNSSNKRAKIAQLKKSKKKFFFQIFIFNNFTIKIYKIKKNVKKISKKKVKILHFLLLRNLQ